jgi:hypothetical protein
LPRVQNQRHEIIKDKGQKPKQKALRRDHASHWKRLVMVILGRGSIQSPENQHQQTAPLIYFCRIFPDDYFIN